MDFPILSTRLAPKRLVASMMLVAALSATAVPAAPPSTGQSGEADDPVIARVNDVEIRESDFRAADREMGRNLPIREDVRREEVMKFLIDTIIFSTAPDKSTLDEAEIRARTAFVRNKVIMEQVIAAVGRKAVSEQAVRKAYDEMVAKMAVEPEYHLYELYFPVADRNDETAMKAAEEKARTAYERITKGEAFEAVVREMSDNPSAKANGGNRGYLTRAMMGGEFAAVVPTLERGKSSQPIKTQAGWHLIKIEDTRMRKPPDLESIRDRLEENLARQAQSEFVDKLRSEAKIQRLDNVSTGRGASEK
ncbi:MAG: peptidylprolyl isomerase [Bradyrhizobium sp.]|nr:peptidylprolyl isomerase [Bradyrhizobium sp.]